MEQHRIETKFGPIEVRVYRLKYGWWPVAIGGRSQLPAHPVVAGDALPTSVEAALHRLSEAIDAMTTERQAFESDGAERRRAEEADPAAALHVAATQPADAARVTSTPPSPAPRPEP